MAKRRNPWIAKLFEFLLIGLVRFLFAFERFIGYDLSVKIGGSLTRLAGPFLKAHRYMMNNLLLVFPEKTDAERRYIAQMAWDNLGRVGAEYAHLEHIVDLDPHTLKTQRGEIIGFEYLEALRDDRKPGIIFSAHTGNWEFLAVAAARLGLNTTSMFREPNDPIMARLVYEIRSKTMGTLQSARPGAAFRIMEQLEDGSHLAMLIDQHFTKGVVVPFMGIPALTNPILAKLVQKLECPVHGARMIRLPKNRFRIELTPPLDFERDENGYIDIDKATAQMTSLIESWVREYPEQWLWMHRRWRVPIQ